MIARLDYTYRTDTNVLLNNRTDRQTSRVKPWLDSKLQVTILLQLFGVLTTFLKRTRIHELYFEIQFQTEKFGNGGAAFKIYQWWWRGIFIAGGGV